MTKEEIEAQIRETERKLRELKEKEAVKKETEEQLRAIEEVKELKEKGALVEESGVTPSFWSIPQEERHKYFREFKRFPREFGVEAIEKHAKECGIIDHWITYDGVSEEYVGWMRKTDTTLTRPFGQPKTEEERQATHQAKYGATELPPRGTGLGGFEANGLKPEGGDIHGTPGVKKAATILTPSGNQRGIVVLWEDDHVTTILGSEEGYGSAYTTSKPEGDKVFYMSCAWAANLGHLIKPIEI